MKTIYLAGGITGLSYEECTGWRKEAYSELTKAGFNVLDPMRGKEHLKDEQCIKSTYQDGAAVASWVIFSRDIADVNNSDILLVNLYNMKGVGTPFEMGYAYGKGKVLIVVAPEYLINHPFVKEPALVTTSSLWSAVEFIKGALR